jgi:hypothetical protein
MSACVCVNDGAPPVVSVECATLPDPIPFHSDRYVVE